MIGVKEPGREHAAEALTRVILAVFRVNGRLIETGDALVKQLGLTSARWQVLGAVALAGAAQTAPQIADAMGLTRQGVQKQLSLLARNGILDRRTNPAHKRSPLYSLSKRGQQLFAATDLEQRRWAEQLAAGFSPEELAVTARVLSDLAAKLADRRDI